MVRSKIESKRRKRKSELATRQTYVHDEYDYEFTRLIYKLWEFWDELEDGRFIIKNIYKNLLKSSKTKFCENDYFIH